VRFISVDIEANQPTNSIIQIGAAAFDTDSKKPHEPVDTFNLYVDPVEEVNWDIDLRGGLTLIQLLGEDFKTKWDKSRVPKDSAFESFWHWCKEVQCGKKFVQWGRGDVYELTRQSKEVGVNYPQRITEVNLKRLYQFFYQPALRLKNKPAGLSFACQQLEIEFQGRAHDALVDATNTGVLAVKMYQIIRGYADIKEIIWQHEKIK
jgi:inhibitor of KinA sporulation pathway (predicted exonuclease)